MGVTKMFQQTLSGDTFEAFETDIGTCDFTDREVASKHYGPRNDPPARMNNHGQCLSDAVVLVSREDRRDVRACHRHAPDPWLREAGIL